MTETPHHALPSTIDVAIIGAGQAGLSLSRCLRQADIEHVIFERGQIAESWRSQRWDSFCLVTPNWATRLAFQDYAGEHPDAFMPGDEVIEMLARYAADFEAPVLEGVEVAAVYRGTDHWRVQCADQEVTARTVVVATGTHREANTPALGRYNEVLPSVHASQYRSPQALAPGVVLVVGSGQSGTQIAEELHAAGREVILATSRVNRLPRRYRGFDSIEWQRNLGLLDRHHRELDSPAARFTPDPHLSGHHGGHTIDLRELGARGIRLTGRLNGFDGKVFDFSDDLQAHLAHADEFAVRFARSVDEHIEAHRLDISPGRREDYEPFPATLPRAIGQLSASSVGVILWATGFRYDFTWIDAPEVFDACGYPQQSGGRTARPGLHFLGLNWVEHRRSGILYGAGVDAVGLARVIACDLGADVPF